MNFGAQITAIILVLSLTEHLTGQERYFYTGKDYGSESLYNPISLILNGGYDVVQLKEFSRDITSYPYTFAGKQVFRMLGSPFRIISRYGWKNFISDQVVPFNKFKQNVQWWPNYHLHLIGGGMEYAQMTEWYEYHNIPSAGVFSFATVATYHLINEIVESGYNSRDDVDAIADIYIFDLGGVILFSFDNVKKYFSKTLNLSDWSLQPSFSLDDGTLRNNGQYFSMKWKPQTWQHWQLFYYFGLNGIVGPSYRFDDNSSLSFGVGARSSVREMLDESTFRQTVRLTWNAGIFYDLNNSLMASLTFSGLNTDLIVLNVYPGIIKIGDFSPGVWLVCTRNLTPSFGITTVWTPGIGIISH